MTGFTADDLIVTNATVTNFSGNGTTYTFDLVPTGAGPVSATVNAGAALTSGGLSNQAAASAFSIVYDATGVPLKAWPLAVALMLTALATIRRTVRAH